MSGIDDAVARALTSLKQVMPASLRAEADAMHLTAMRNWWEFAAPPVTSETLMAVGYAIRNGHLLRFNYLTPDGRRPHPKDADFTPPVQVEPHHLVTWAGRWYLVAFTLATQAWRIYRVDRIHPHAPTGAPFQRRQLTEPDVTHFVITSWDRGDTPAPLAVSRYRPHRPASAPRCPVGAGGSVVEYVSATQARITVGAWSWAGVAGLLATFDADITVLEPDELRDACRTIAQRCQQASE